MSHVIIRKNAVTLYPNNFYSFDFITIAIACAANLIYLTVISRISSSPYEEKTRRRIYRVQTMKWQQQ